MYWVCRSKTAAVVCDAATPRSKARTASHAGQAILVFRFLISALSADRVSNCTEHGDVGKLKAGYADFKRVFQGISGGESNNFQEIELQLQYQVIP